MAVDYIPTWQIELVDQHLAMWYQPEEVEQIWASEQPFWMIRAELGMYDLAFFCRCYLREYFGQEWAACHWDLVDDLQTAISRNQPAELAESLPRGFGKSTVVCVGLPMWTIIGQSPVGTRGAERKPLRPYIIVCKDSFDQSKLELASIRHEFETNALIRHDYGDFVGEPWRQTELVTSNGAKVDAMGTGQKIRGRRHKADRPSLIILDDLENDETVVSPTQRLKCKRWISKAVEKAGDPRNNVFVFIGTHLHYDCAQAWMAKRPGVRSRVYKALLQDPQAQDLWDEWEDLLLNLFDEDREETAELFYQQNKLEMDGGAKVSWPQRFPYKTLRLMMLGERHDEEGRRIRSFSAEMQNEPIDEADRLFKNFHYWHWEQEKGFWYLVPYKAGQRVGLHTCRLIGACDPSLGESRGGSYSALIDILVSPQGMQFVAHAGIKRQHPDRIIDDIRSQCQYWARRGLFYSAYCIETVQFQKLFASKAGQDLLASGIRLPIQEIQATMNKNARIDSLQPDIQNGYVLLYKKQGRETPEDQQLLYDQLWQYPMGDFIDGPDALEMGRTWAAVGGGRNRRIDHTELLAPATFGLPTAGDPFS